MIVSTSGLQAQEIKALATSHVDDNGVGSTKSWLKTEFKVFESEFGLLYWKNIGSKSANNTLTRGEKQTNQN